VNPVEFRAWDKEREEWAKDDVIINKNGKPMIWDSEIEMYVGYPLEINLYTGLNDKNGQKIFAKDIVKVYQLTDNYERTHITDIIWEECAFVAKGYGTKDKDYYDTCLGAWFNPDVPLVELEVIGNKYENADLLEIEVLGVENNIEKEIKNV